MFRWFVWLIINLYNQYTTTFCFPQVQEIIISCTRFTIHAHEMPSRTRFQVRMNSHFNQNTKIPGGFALPGIIFYPH